MSEFTIKCFKRLRSKETNTPEYPFDDMFHTITTIDGADRVEVVDNARGQTVSGYTFSGAVAFRETVPHYDIPDNSLPFDTEFIKFVVVENKHGKTTQTIRAASIETGTSPKPTAPYTR